MLCAAWATTAAPGPLPVPGTYVMVAAWHLPDQSHAQLRRRGMLAQTPTTLPPMQNPGGNQNKCTYCGDL